MNDAPDAKSLMEADPFVKSYPELRPFWDAANEGRFLLPTCTDCGRAHWYPRALCPFCESTKLNWKESPGVGRIYTFSVMRRTDTPYVLAYVQLDEGPVMMTNILNLAVDDVRIGQRVSVLFQQAQEGRRIPFFAPEPAANGAAQADLKQ